MTPFRFRSLGLLFLFGISQEVGAAPLASVGSKTYVAKVSKLWTEPNRFGEPVAELRVGLPLEVLDYDASRSWILVRTPSGREGWLPLRFTSQDTRRTQPMISHKGGGAAEDSEGRAPAGKNDSFEDVVAKDEAKEKKAAEVKQKASGPGFPVDLALGYSNQLSVEKAHGFSLSATAFWEIDSNLKWGAGLGWKRHSKSVEGACFTTDTCEVSRSSQRFFPHGAIQYLSAGMQIGALLGLAVDRTSLRTYNQTSGQVEETDDNGLKITGTGTEWRLGFALRAAYSFSAGATMRIGPYIDYDLDLSFSDGSGDFAGEPTSKLSHYFGGGVLLQWQL